MKKELGTRSTNAAMKMDKLVNSSPKVNNRETKLTTGSGEEQFVKMEDVGKKGHPFPTTIKSTFSKNFLSVEGTKDYDITLSMDLFDMISLEFNKEDIKTKLSSFPYIKDVVLTEQNVLLLIDKSYIITSKENTKLSEFLNHDLYRYINDSVISDTLLKMANTNKLKKWKDEIVLEIEINTFVNKMLIKPMITKSALIDSVSDSLPYNISKVKISGHSLFVNINSYVTVPGYEFKASSKNMVGGNMSMPNHRFIELCTEKLQIINKEFGVAMISTSSALSSENNAASAQLKAKMIDAQNYSKVTVPVIKFNPEIFKKDVAGKAQSSLTSFMNKKSKKSVVQSIDDTKILTTLGFLMEGTVFKYIVGGTNEMAVLPTFNKLCRFALTNKKDDTRISISTKTNSTTVSFTFAFGTTKK